MGANFGGLGFGGTSERSGPSSGQKVTRMVAFLAVEIMVYGASPPYYHMKISARELSNAYARLLP